MPRATLAAVVIGALARSANPRKARSGAEGFAGEFAIAVVVLLAVLVLDTLTAVILGVIVSLTLVIYRVSFPQTSELGPDPISDRLESRTAHEEARPIPGIVVYRFEAPHAYVNAQAFSDGARSLVEVADPPARLLVVDAS